VLGEDLDCHVAPEMRVARAVDLTHPARAQRRQNPVITNPAAGLQRQTGASRTVHHGRSAQEVLGLLTVRQQ